MHNKLKNKQQYPLKVGKISLSMMYLHFVKQSKDAKSSSWDASGKERQAI
jgi:hypothetical protein